MKIRTGTGLYMNETAMACGWSEETGTYALAQVLNEFAAEGADCLGVEAGIFIPPSADNTKAYAMERCIRRACLEKGVEAVRAEIRKNPLYGIPVVMITGAGRLKADGVEAGPAKIEGTKTVSAKTECIIADTHNRQDISECEIVLVKWIGLEGMLRIVEERESELRQRFAPVFLRQIRSYKKEIFAGAKLEIARTAGAVAVRQITEGGIFAALWGLAKDAGTGFDVDMKRISILQETIEVCEHYRLNPYQLTSAGSFLLLAQRGEALADALRKNQTEASVIGRLAKGNDKVIHNGGDVRCLDRPAPDEIYKIYQELILNQEVR
ncbi:AIR synthase-related protein [Lachnospiraceae bacterium 62-26]